MARDFFTSPQARKTLLRHQAGATVATVVDFSTMIACVHLLTLTPTVGTAIGAACGAIANFTMSRRWIFDGAKGPIGPQAARYALVSFISLVLNALGEKLLFDGLHIQYIVARLIVAITVSVCWNFTMHRLFVFRAEVPR